MRNIKFIKLMHCYMAIGISLLCALDGYSQCTGGMTGTTLVCPNDVKSYTVNKTCQQIVWELPAGGTINSITNGGKTANITWGTDRGNFTPTADLVQCSPSSGPNAYCTVHVIKPTTPTTLTTSNAGQTVYFTVSGSTDVTTYNWNFPNGLPAQWTWSLSGSQNQTLVVNTNNYKPPVTFTISASNSTCGLTSPSKLFTGVSGY